MTQRPRLYPRSAPRRLSGRHFECPGSQYVSVASASGHSKSRNLPSSPPSSQAGCRRFEPGRPLRRITRTSASSSLTADSSAFPPPPFPPRRLTSPATARASSKRAGRVSRKQLLDFSSTNRPKKHHAVAGCAPRSKSRAGDLGFDLKRSSTSLLQ